VPDVCEATSVDVVGAMEASVAELTSADDATDATVLTGASVEANLDDICSGVDVGA